MSPIERRQNKLDRALYEVLRDKQGEEAEKSVATLLEAGADANAYRGQEGLPLAHALQFNQAPAVIQLLADHGAHFEAALSLLERNGASEYKDRLRALQSEITPRTPASPETQIQTQLEQLLKQASELVEGVKGAQRSVVEEIESAVQREKKLEEEKAEARKAAIKAQMPTLQEKFHKAVLYCKWPEAEALIKEGVVPAEKSLAYTVKNARSGWQRWAAQLIKAGAKPTADMLYTATIYGDWTTAKALIDGGAVPPEKTLTYAVKNGTMGWKGWAEELIKAGAKPTAGMLYTATLYGDWTTAKALIDGGTVPDEKTLFHTVKNGTGGWRGWAEELIKAGAKPTADMLYTATLYGDWTTAKALIDGGTVPDEKTLFHTVKNGTGGWRGWAEELIKAGAKPTEDMLHIATIYRDWVTAEALVEGGATPAEKTLVHIARNESSGWQGWANAISKIVEKRKLQQNSQRQAPQKQPSP